MTTSTDFDCMSRQGGKPEGVMGQKAVAPSFSLTVYFHRAQARLKNRKAGGDVKGGEVVRPLFQPEFAGAQPLENRQRWIRYQMKLAELEAA